jgi:hypothetical protein
LKHRANFTRETEDCGFYETVCSDVLLQNTRSSVDLSDKIVRFYFETTYDMFQRRGSVEAVEVFVASLYNKAAVLYQNEGITTALSEIFIWDVLDLFADIDVSAGCATWSQNSLLYLQRFQNLRMSFNGDLGHLLTHRSLCGGRAAGFNGLCNSDKTRSLAVAEMWERDDNPPNFCNMAHGIVHEFGHLFGSPHTHACVWNGNRTALDGCAPTEGVCPRPEVPPFFEGTIMSYCPVINLNLGFGPQPGDTIRGRVNNAACLVYFSGPEVICSFGEYTIGNGVASWWGVSDGFIITSSNANSATVMATSLDGQTGTLKAIVDGTGISRPIRACCDPTVISITNETITTNTIFTSCGCVNAKNVTITNNATLTLKANGDINLQNVVAKPGSKLILDASGKIHFGPGFKVELGGELEIR